MPKGWDPKVTPRDAAIVADVIQWLATNCGRCFLGRCFERAGFRMHYEERSTATSKRWQRNWKRRNARAEAKRKREEAALQKNTYRRFDMSL